MEGCTGPRLPCPSSSALSHSSPTGSPHRQCLCLFRGALPGLCGGVQGAQGRVGPVEHRLSDRSSHRLWGDGELWQDEAGQAAQNKNLSLLDSSLRDNDT